MNRLQIEERLNALEIQAKDIQDEVQELKASIQHDSDNGSASDNDSTDISLGKELARSVAGETRSDREAKYAAENDNIVKNCS